MYSASEICKPVGGLPFLQGAGLSCGRGEVVCVIGPNGAGKTLLLKALTLVDPPTSGRIEVGGAGFVFPDSNSTNPPPPWPTITYVFQQLFLWPHLSVEANIALTARATAGSSLEARAHARALAKRLGIEEALDRFPNEISGGQKQRVALARALAVNPTWLFLDEPNAALDVEQNQLLRDIILDLKENGGGVVLSTHLVGFAAAVADRVIFLDQGRILEEGPPTILFKPQTERLRRFLSMVELVRP